MTKTGIPTPEALAEAARQRKLNGTARPADGSVNPPSQPIPAEPDQPAKEPEQDA
jgi:hypothetical protein